jgi:hypothetical protein
LSNGRTCSTAAEYVQHVDSKVSANPTTPCWATKINCEPLRNPIHLYHCSSKCRVQLYPKIQFLDASSFPWEQ